MAHVVMGTQVTGYVVTASDWNEIVGNFIAGATDAMTAAGDIWVGTGANAGVKLAAFTSSTGTLKHESGGIELDISAITTGGMLIGASAGVFEILPYGNDDQVILGVSGKPAWGAGTGQATKAELEAESNVDKYGPPDLLKHLPWATKVFCSFLGNGTLSANSYNMTSTARNSVGNYTLTYDTDFTDLDYTPGATPEGGENLTVTISSPAAGTTNVFTWDDASADNKADAITHFYAWGDQ